MNDKIFRKKSIDRMSSPEQLNDYIKVTNAKCWSTKAAWNCIMGIFVSALFEFGAFKTNGEIATILCSIGELMVAVYMLYLTVRINFRMAKAFGHGVGFGFGLWLFPYIFTFIIGFGKSEYSGNPLPKAKNKQ